MKKYSSLTERKIIEAVKSGDTRAFDHIINKHRLKLLAWITQKCGDLDREEIYQLTVNKSWKYIKGFKGASTFYTWLVSIARNLIYDSFRYNSRRKAESLEVFTDAGNFSRLPCSDPEVFKKIKHKETVGNLEDCMEKIPPAHARILSIIMRNEDATYEEIAKELGCPVGTVMSRLFYARKNLRKHYEKSLTYL